MKSSVMLDRRTAEGKRYGDVIDVADFLGESQCGSAPNAIAQMARQSQLFKRTLDSAEFQTWISARNAEPDSN